MKLQLKKSNRTQPGPTTGSVSATQGPAFKEREAPRPHVQVETQPALTATGLVHIQHQQHLLLLLHLLQAKNPDAF